MASNTSEVDMRQFAGKCLLLAPRQLTCLWKSPRRTSRRWRKSAPCP